MKRFWKKIAAPDHTAIRCAYRSSCTTLASVGPHCGQLHRNAARWIMLTPAAPHGCQRQQSAKQWRIQGGFLVARKPPPPGRDFFVIRGLTPLLAPIFTSLLNLRLLETPLETNSGYSTAKSPTVVGALTPMKQEVLLHANERRLRTQRANVHWNRTARHE